MICSECSLPLNNCIFYLYANFVKFLEICKSYLSNAKVRS